MNNKDKRIIFMGTPIFSVPVLEALIKNYNVVLVVTQPDKEVGRKKQIEFSPVKQVAIDNNIPVLQPRKLRLEYQEILEYKPDVIITCAYGQILPEPFLDFPPYKTINVHASLLPKLRGGAPIHHAIIEGHEKTGITIMRTNKGMDSGDIISKKETPILSDDTYDTLSKKLSVLGAELLIETLPSIFDGTAVYTKQNKDEVTLGYTISRDDEKIDFSKSTLEVYNKIRGLSSVPGGYAYLFDKEIKIYQASIGTNSYKEPGVIFNIYKDGIGVSTLDGEIILKEIQLSGKKRMLVRDFLNGVSKDKLLYQKLK